jgi:uncharacterized protein YciI
MKHFIVQVNYLVPFEQFGDAAAAHLSFLKQGYQRGLLLFSGPLVPRTGGLAVARASSVEELDRFFDADPYRVHGLAEQKFIEFDPVLWQDFLKDWIAKD